VIIKKLPFKIKNHCLPSAVKAL